MGTIDLLVSDIDRLEFLLNQKLRNPDGSAVVGAEAFAASLERAIKVQKDMLEMYRVLGLVSEEEKK